MSVYLDASLVVAILANEPRSADARAWLDAQAVGELVISDWTITEVSSALALKLRVGRITEPDRAKALAAFHGLLDDSFTILPIGGPTFRAAAAIADRAD
ncbi:MAG: type II toxin-antitoxin system VapC family toxin, partial [Caulobacteraceae bacterium]